MASGDDIRITVNIPGIDDLQGSVERIRQELMDATEAQRRARENVLRDIEQFGAVMVEGHSATVRRNDSLGDFTQGGWTGRVPDGAPSARPDSVLDAFNRLGAFPSNLTTFSNVPQPRAGDRVSFNGNTYTVAEDAPVARPSLQDVVRRVCYLMNYMVANTDFKTSNRFRVVTTDGIKRDVEEEKQYLCQRLHEIAAAVADGVPIDQFKEATVAPKPTTLRRIYR